MLFSDSPGFKKPPSTFLERPLVADLSNTSFQLPGNPSISKRLDCVTTFLQILYLQHKDGKNSGSAALLDSRDRLC